MLTGMKTFRKLFLITSILAVCIGLLFFFGWTQFSVPAGKYGIMLSKSGGYHREVIMPGSFTWRWERLIPTNARILIFDLAPRQINYAVEGSLPSADQYSRILNTNIDFSWSFSANALVTLKPEQLVAVIKKHSLQTQEDFEAYIDSHIQSALQTIMHRYITDLLDNPYEYQQLKTNYHAFSEKIKGDLAQLTKEEFSIEAVSLSKITVPDLHAYKLAEQAYHLYEQQREMLLAETAAKEAQYAASEQFQIERLTKWGEFLAKYPHIIELIAAAQRDSKAALSALKSIEKQGE